MLIKMRIKAYCVLRSKENVFNIKLLCFSINMKDWEDLDFVKECPLLLVTIGKCKESRREWLNDVDSADDKKPEPNEVIRWI